MKTESIINRMTKQDIGKVISIGLETPEFRTDTSAEQFYSEQSLRRWVGDKGGVTLVARVNNEVVGFLLGYYMQGPNDGYLNCLAMLEAYRGRGVGKRLLEQALKEFEAKGCNHVFGVVKEDNKKTLNFFENNGLEIGESFRYVETMLPLNE